MQERAEAVNFKGAMRAVVGPQLEPGDRAPAFEVMNQALEVIDPLAESRGKVRIFSVMPSLDTGVCDRQTRRFNEEAAKLGEKVAIYCISADLPFAQKRWCGAADIKGVQVVSDARDMAFGNAYGTHIKDFRLDMRSVFVVDQNDVVRHAEYITQTGNEPAYDVALDVARKLAG